ncbi:AGZA family xanthine/uracil permease-like MFS transporter [Kordia periserrulae]|uniref:AGZA family xanthine/uracil permease-like MFS transporter n=1 Tax=Kordia periserrulae TaxID=701523 RepID=A0A2T6BQN4_9FLAO|nr:NCS2 family permease [Kordia periserrulae]PTX58401.1 AGZA family xanthine/uracil permease-like MFS transporter [Kordia periserrulae]
MKNKIDKYFKIKEKGSTINTELLAGLSTFMSLAYIVVVNPAILSEGGINKSAVFFATIAVSGIFTIIMGLKAKLPFALAPGLEMDAYVAFYIVAVLGFSWQQGLAIVFYSTLIFFILSIVGLRGKIVDSIPNNMKHTLAASVGMFLIMIGFKISNMVAFEGATPIGIGDLTGQGAITLYIGLAVIILLEKILKFKASILISIIVMAVYANYVGLADDMQGAELSMEMFSAIGSFWTGLDVILDPRSWAPILILFLVDFYGSVAKIIGLTVGTNIFPEKGSEDKKIKGGLMVDGFAALTSPIVGTSSVTTFVESSVGIKEGGRTGLTAVVIGVLLLACLLLTPLIKFVPVVATSSALIWVGLWLMPKGMIKIFSDNTEIWDRFKTIDKVILCLMLLVVVLSFSLQYALIIGYGGYVVKQIIDKDKKPNVYLIASLVVLIIGTVAQWLT